MLTHAKRLMIGGEGREGKNKRGGGERKEREGGFGRKLEAGG